ncbi:MAG: toxin-antitoxin system HicB family antitoxin [Marinilabiliaceae bacterium]
MGSIMFRFKRQLLVAVQNAKIAFSIYMTIMGPAILHRKASLAAVRKNMNLNQFIQKAIEDELNKEDTSAH